MTLWEYIDLIISNPTLGYLIKTTIMFFICAGWCFLFFFMVFLIDCLDREKRSKK